MSKRKRRQRLDGATQVYAANDDILVSVRVGHDGSAYIGLGDSGHVITEQEAYEIGDLLLRWAKQQGGMA